MIFAMRCNAETAFFTYIIKNTISFLPETHLMNEPELFSILDCVDSTNNYAMGQVHAGLARHGQAWFAKEQTAGKGQRGKQWESRRGENITISIVFMPTGLRPDQLFTLSVAVSLGCFDFFTAAAGNKTSIKWPNDIFWGDRKAGGILIENIIQGNSWKYAVIGIGININQIEFNPGTTNATSLKQITHKDHDTVALAKKLYASVMKRIEEMNTDSFSSLLQEYNLHLYKLNSLVTLKKAGVIFKAEITGVKDNGKLLTAGVSDNEFDFGEVEWLL